MTTAREQARKLCPYWIMSMKLDWMDGFCYAASGRHHQDSEDGDPSCWSEGWRTGKEWREAQERKND